MVRRTRKKAEGAESTKSVRSAIMVEGEIAGDEREIFEKEIHQFITDPAFVRAAVGVTKNMGNYEFLRVDVAVTLPCYQENVNETYKVAAELAGEFLDEEVGLYMEEFPDGG